MVRGPSITQSALFFFSNRQVLQMNSSTSPKESLRPVTRSISLCPIHTTTLPEQVVQSRCAFIGLANHTLLLKRKVLSVRAPTGQTSIMFPENSFSTEFLIKVEISETSPRYITPCTLPLVIWLAVSTQR